MFVGADVGLAEVGARVGVPVAPGATGAFVGAFVGICVGSPVAAGVGEVGEGACVGAMDVAFMGVGARVGFALAPGTTGAFVPAAAGVGDGVGEGVGDGVGAGVGTIAGIAVFPGAAVGAPVLPLSAKPSQITGKSPVLDPCSHIPMIAKRPPAKRPGSNVVMQNYAKQHATRVEF
jgi:hypothetical protein